MNDRDERIVWAFFAASAMSGASAMPVDELARRADAMLAQWKRRFEDKEPSA